MILWLAGNDLMTPRNLTLDMTIPYRWSDLYLPFHIFSCSHVIAFNETNNSNRVPEEGKYYDFSNNVELYYEDTYEEQAGSSVCSLLVGPYEFEEFPHSSSNYTYINENDVETSSTDATLTTASASTFSLEEYFLSFSDISVESTEISETSYYDFTSTTTSIISSEESLLSFSDIAAEYTEIVATSYIGPISTSTSTGTGTASAEGRLVSFTDASAESPETVPDSSSVGPPVFLSEYDTESVSLDPSLFDMSSYTSDSLISKTEIDTGTETETDIDTEPEVARDPVERYTTTPPDGATVGTPTSSSSTTSGGGNPLEFLISLIWHDERYEGEETQRYPRMEFQVMSVEPALNSLWKVTFHIHSAYDPVLMHELLGSDMMYVDLDYSVKDVPTSLILNGPGAPYAYSNPFDIQASILIAPSVHGDYFCLPDDLRFTYEADPVTSSWMEVFYIRTKYFVNTELPDLDSNAVDSGAIDEQLEVGHIISNFCWKIPDCSESDILASLSSEARLVAFPTSDYSSETDSSISSPVTEESESSIQNESQSLESFVSKVLVQLPVESATESMVEMALESGNASELNGFGSSSIETEPSNVDEPTSESLMESSNETENGHTVESMGEIEYAFTSEWGSDSPTGSTTRSTIDPTTESEVEMWAYSSTLMGAASAIDATSEFESVTESDSSTVTGIELRSYSDTSNRGFETEATNNPLLGTETDTFDAETSPTSSYASELYNGPIISLETNFVSIWYSSEISDESAIGLNEVVSNSNSASTPQAESTMAAVASDSSFENTNDWGTGSMTGSSTETPVVYFDFSNDMEYVYEEENGDRAHTSVCLVQEGYYELEEVPFSTLDPLIGNSNSYVNIVSEINFVSLVVASIYPNELSVYLTLGSSVESTATSVEYNTNEYGDSVQSPVGVSDTSMASSVLGSYISEAPFKFSATGLESNAVAPGYAFESSSESKESNLESSIDELEFSSQPAIESSAIYTESSIIQPAYSSETPIETKDAGFESSTSEFDYSSQASPHTASVVMESGVIESEYVLETPTSLEPSLVVLTSLTSENLVETGRGAVLIDVVATSAIDPLPLETVPVLSSPETTEISTVQSSSAASTSTTSTSTTSTSTTSTSTATTTTVNNNGLYGPNIWTWRDDIYTDDATNRYPRMSFEVLSVEPAMNSVWKVTFHMKSAYDPVVVFQSLGPDPITVDLEYSNNGVHTSLRLYETGGQTNYSNPFDIQATILVVPSVHGNHFCLPDDFAFTYETDPRESTWSDEFYIRSKYFVNPDLQEFNLNEGGASESITDDDLTELIELGQIVSNFCWRIPVCSASELFVTSSTETRLYAFSASELSSQTVSLLSIGFAEESESSTESVTGATAGVVFESSTKPGSMTYSTTLLAENLVMSDASTNEFASEPGSVYTHGLDTGISEFVSVATTTQATSMATAESSNELGEASSGSSAKLMISLGLVSLFETMSDSVSKQETVSESLEGFGATSAIMPSTQTEALFSIESTSASEATNLSATETEGTSTIQLSVGFSNEPSSVSEAVFSSESATESQNTSTSESTINQDSGSGLIGESIDVFATGTAFESTYSNTSSSAGALIQSTEFRNGSEFTTELPTSTSIYFNSSYSTQVTTGFSSEVFAAQYFNSSVGAIMSSTPPTMLSNTVRTHESLGLTPESQYQSVGERASISSIMQSSPQSPTRAPLNTANGNDNFSPVIFSTTVAMTTSTQTSSFGMGFLWNSSIAAVPTTISFTRQESLLVTISEPMEDTSESTSSFTDLEISSMGSLNAFNEPPTATSSDYATESSDSVSTTFSGSLSSYSVIGVVSVTTSESIEANFDLEQPKSRTTTWQRSIESSVTPNPSMDTTLAVSFSLSYLDVATSNWPLPTISGISGSSWSSELDTIEYGSRLSSTSPIGDLLYSVEALLQTARPIANSNSVNAQSNTVAESADDVSCTNMSVNENEESRSSTDNAITTSDLGSSESVTLEYMSLIDEQITGSSFYYNMETTTTRGQTLPSSDMVLSSMVSRYMNTSSVPELGYVEAAMSPLSLSAPLSISDRGSISGAVLPTQDIPQAESATFSRQYWLPESLWTSEGFDFASFTTIAGVSYWKTGAPPLVIQESTSLSLNTPFATDAEESVTVVAAQTNTPIESSDLLSASINANSANVAPPLSVEPLESESLVDVVAHESVGNYEKETVAPYASSKESQVSASHVTPMFSLSPNGGEQHLQNGEGKSSNGETSDATAVINSANNESSHIGTASAVSVSSSHSTDTAILTDDNSDSLVDMDQQMITPNQHTESPNTHLQDKAEESTEEEAENKVPDSSSLPQGRSGLTTLDTIGSTLTRTFSTGSSSTMMIFDYGDGATHLVPSIMVLLLLLM
ncbi:hypothetical protein KGF57_001460 [Candida theae]|uniref:Flo11 domain-containing protein n=1 Tax=Candida theae TaxID=1198502 RepID=A0AAD5FZR8_9ASCO|nr:uncharacterized protein KGF57_001460 [Candida theae]KAI5962726.1 hypothetical protein KGF57_001460 [Candida theae]